MSQASPQVDTPPIAHDPNTGVSVVRNYRPCSCGCGQDTLVRVHGKAGLYGHLTPRSASAAAAPAPAPEAEREPDDVEKSMFQLLQESITASRKRPVLRIPTVGRTVAPWSLMTERMRGEHRYRVENVAGTVKIFDRNGSYPSAMANVPVAAAELRRTGAIGFSTAHAGIYLIPRFAWTDGPHPLGEIADQPGDEWWVTTPHMRLVIKLVAQQRIPGWSILDSWTAPAVTNLFKQFSADVSEQREAARGTDAYDEVKRKSSIAIRSLWPKATRSPFWRPDWSLSVRAEAAVRHWVRADQAVQAGAQLVRLGNVDEVAFLQPRNARSSWVPEPYKLGDGFGYVKAKNTVPAAEWNRGPRR